MFKPTGPAVPLAGSASIIGIIRIWLPIPPVGRTLVVPTCASRDRVGPIAMSVEDAALLLNRVPGAQSAGRRVRLHLAREP